MIMNYQAGCTRASASPIPFPRLIPATSTSGDGRRAFTKNLESIYRFFWSEVGNREEAEDLTTEVHHSVGHLLAGERMDAEAMDAIESVARSILDEHYRRYYRTMPDVRRSTHSSPPAQRSAAEILEALPPTDRRVLELRLLRGYSIEETAVELGVSAAEVRTTQRRVLAQAACVRGGQHSA